MEKKVLSVTEVARELGVAPVTVRRWLQAKIINGFQLPRGHYRIPAREVQRIRSNTNELSANSVATLCDERQRVDKKATE